MKFLVFFLLALDLLCCFFLWHDGRGSGMGKVIAGLTAATALLLCYNRFFGAGTWLGDEANGH